ncbi:MAG: hypothetical protein JRI50_06635 [Deltaproteobacteria bacterium]|nr:hypothetical protein [Deltaproteobacteria bacterium]MBW2134998.1 hypothetical protein [Deltaproteobacteria bacterium]
MGRKLADEPQTLRVRDPISGTVITLYYRIPTSEERVAYQTSAFRIEGQRRQLRLGETRLKFGLEIMTGFAPGDFYVIKDGQEVPLDAATDSDWKEQLARHAPDLISFLGQYVFEGLRAESAGSPNWGE